MTSRTIKTPNRTGKASRAKVSKAVKEIKAKRMEAKLREMVEELLPEINKLISNRALRDKLDKWENE